MSKASEVAFFFLAKGSMSPKKLQKLTYYAYSWTLALLDQRLFDERIEAWVHGPVVPSLYQKYRGYGWNEIPKIENFDLASFSAEEITILNRVWVKYGSKSADELELLTHGDLPWKNARSDRGPFVSCDTELSDNDISMYFSKQSL